MEITALGQGMKLRSVEEELVYLRGKIAERKMQGEKIGLQQNEEKIARTEIAEYKRIAPIQILHPEFKIDESEALKKAGAIIGEGGDRREGTKLKLTPEEHDDKMAELMALVEEKGIKNALSVVEKLGDFHLTDDFHRYLVEYIKEGGNVGKVKSKDRLHKSLKMALYEVAVSDDSNSSNQNREKTLKEIISSMEQFYAGMLSISTKESLKEEGDSFISLEIGNSNKSGEVIFYVAVPENRSSLFEKQILSVFHGAKISRLIDDYNIFNETGVTLGVIGKLEKSGAFPLRTYDSFDHDPLNALLNSFSKVDTEGEGAAIQLIWSPAGDSYVKSYRGALDKILKGVSVKEALDMPESLSGSIFKEFKSFLNAGKTKDKDKPEEVKNIDQIAVEEIKRKIESPIVKCNLRILASSRTESEAKEILESIESSFNQFQNTTGNTLKWIPIKGSDLKDLVRNFSFRMFDDANKIPLSLKEITTMVHFHTGAITSGDQLKQTRSTTAPAPVDIPKEGTLLGMNKHRNIETAVFMSEEDRLRHFYTIGQTGTGKSTLLKNMIIQDIRAGNGVCMIDPHGSDIIDVLANIPPERYEDVIYFDPAYIERPMALNMLEYDPNFPEQKTFVVNELFSIFRKLYGSVPESMGPAFEQYFRNSALLVMEDPDSGNTLVDVSRVLSDKKYREYKISKCKNPLISQFWINAEKTTGDQGLSNYVQYVTNKFDVFLQNDIMRPVIAQEKSSWNFRDIMDNRKILLVNLSKGRLGDINANLIGLILVGKILMAALSRGSESVNLPPFYLYIDEFQNITTDSISTILSEARKYKLSLNIAHQYIAQLEEKIRDAVFGNVGSICAFRVGAEDAEKIEGQFAPVFNAHDLMNVDNRNAYLKLLVHGRPVKPFNIETISPPQGDVSKIEHIKELSYAKYGKPREEVEKMILEKYKLI